MTKRLEILQQALVKKEERFDSKLSEHFSAVRAVNGQPLNDKRNGSATLNKWERQNDALRNLKSGIEITKAAIEREENKIHRVESANNMIPVEILNLVESGELVQWRKHPTFFFVDGVDKARIHWDIDKKVVGHRYFNLVTEKEQRSKFVKIYNALNAVLNKT